LKIVLLTGSNFRGAYKSTAVLNFISMLDGDEGEQYRWQVALKAIDLFLDDFHYTLEQKRDLVKTLHKNFSDELKVGTAEQKKISERFSNSKKLVELLMSDEWKKDVNLKRAISVFKIDSNVYSKAIGEILSSLFVHHGKERLNNLMPSYLHMFINRIFISNQRKIELVIYDYLLKYYESKIAREKKRIAGNIPELINTD
jgi:thiopeptide-type bacteriocin biosynthesis protein